MILNYLLFNMLKTLYTISQMDRFKAKFRYEHIGNGSGAGALQRSARTTRTFNVKKTSVKSKLSNIDNLDHCLKKLSSLCASACPVVPEDGTGALKLRLITLINQLNLRFMNHLPIDMEDIKELKSKLIILCVLCVSVVKIKTEVPQWPVY